MEPFLPNLNLFDALSPQLRVNGGEFPTKSVIVDHLLDGTAQLFCSQFTISQDLANAVFTLVTFHRTVSAKLQNFDKDIHVELGPT